MWRLSANGGEAIQVTDLPLDVGSFRLASNAGRIAVTLEVFADCNDLPCTVDRLEQTKKAKDSGEVYDRIFARHWDTWTDGRISQLFVLKLSNGVATEPVSVSKALDADVPSKPFGDATEYTFSPDGSKLVFSTRLKGKSEPWSTNFDLYEVGADGSGLRNLTEDNPAWDTQPVFSRDGTQLAWRAMERPGFEADRFHIVIHGSEERPASRAHQGMGSFRRRHGVRQRRQDAVCDDRSFRPASAVVGRCEDRQADHADRSGRIEAFSVGEKEIVLATSSLKSPAELQALTIKGGDLRALLA